MYNQGMSLNQDTSLKISLSYLIQIIAAICVAVYAYANLNDRLSAIENNLLTMKEDIDANYEWRENWESGGILPLDVSQNEKIAFLEKELDALRTRELEQLQCKNPN